MFNENGFISTFSSLIIERRTLKIIAPSLFFCSFFLSSYPKPKPTMNIIPLLLKEMDQEAVVTRKMLARVPDGKWDWKPHEKSMTMKQLTTHIAELPGWVHMALTTDELDFAKIDYKPTPINQPADLVRVHDQSFERGRSALSKAKEEDLLPEWKLRKGDQIFNVFTKYEMIRQSFSQITHHRAQLGVYLRLLNIPIPGSYGPSADEMTF